MNELETLMQPFDAELAVIGCILNGGGEKAFREARSVVGAKDFTGDHYRRAFDAIEDQCELRGGIEVHLLVDSLVKQGTMNREGWTNLFWGACEYIMSPSAVKDYALSMRDTSLRRGIRARAFNLADKAFSDVSVEELRAEADGLVQGIDPRSPVHPVSACRPKGRRSAVSTGFAKLDQINEVGGYVSGQLTIIAAYTKTGKTTFMLNSCYRALVRGLRCLYITVADLGNEDIYGKLTRQVCGWSHAPDRLDLLESYSRACETVDTFDLLIYDASAVDMRNDVETLRATFKAEHAKKPFDLVFVDYAQELTTSQRTSGRVEDQITCASVLRVLAAQSKIPFVVGSQITEGKNGGQDTTKDTRAWEEKAGWILRLKRDSFNSDHTLFKCPFSRFGGQGTQVMMGFDKQTERLAEL